MASELFAAAMPVRPSGGFGSNWSDDKIAAAVAVRKIGQHRGADQHRFGYRESAPKRATGEVGRPRNSFKLP